MDAEPEFKTLIDALTQSTDLTRREIALAVLYIFHARHGICREIGTSPAYLSKCFCKARRVLETAGIRPPRRAYLE